MRKVVLYLLLVLCLGMTVIKVPYTFTESTRSQWNALLDVINNSPEQDFILLWEGLGGKLDIALLFYKKLNKTKKHVIIQIIGDSVSAHSLVYCYVRDKVVFKSGDLVFHNSYEGRNSVGHKNFTDSTTYEILNQCVLTGIITKDDENNIIQRKLRMYVYPNGRKVTYQDWE